MNAVLLIDLDAAKEEKDKRLNENYKNFDTPKIFFMIQEMEAWIISQPDKIEEFGENEGLERKKTDKGIKNSSLLKGKHPEQIRKPSEKLDTILRQYFICCKNNKRKQKAKKRKTILKG